MFYGIGLAGRSNPGVSWAEANESGEFSLYTGIGDVGQGSSTVLAQIAAEVWKCKAEEIRVIAGDTDCCPDSGVTAASRVTYVVGRSAQIAAQKLERMLREAAASIIEISPEDLNFAGGSFYPPEAPRRSVSVSQAAKKLKEQGISPRAEGIFDPHIKPLDPQTTQGDPMATYAFATQGALVSFDVDSGEVEVLSLIACHDVGRAVNPDNVTAQIEGAVHGPGLCPDGRGAAGKGKDPEPLLRRILYPHISGYPPDHLLRDRGGRGHGSIWGKGIGRAGPGPYRPGHPERDCGCRGHSGPELPATPEALWKLLPSK